MHPQESLWDSVSQWGGGCSSSTRTGKCGSKFHQRRHVMQDFQTVFHPLVFPEAGRESPLKRDTCSQVLLLSGPLESLWLYHTFFVLQGSFITFFFNCNTQTGLLFITVEALKLMTIIYSSAPTPPYLQGIDSKDLQRMPETTNCTQPHTCSSSFLQEST